MALISESCESCGTPLPAPDAAGLITCPSCGRVTREDEPTPAPAPAPSTWLPDASADPRSITIHQETVETVVKVAKVGRGCSIVVSLIIVASVVGGIALAVNSGTNAVKSVTDALTPSSSSNAISLSGSVEPIAATPDPTDFLVVVQDYKDGDSHRYLTRVKLGAAGFSEVWRSAALPSSASAAKVAAVGDTLFAGFDDNVWAVSLATGKQQWTASLRDSITNCVGCFAVAEGHLVVRTQDAYLTGFAPASSEQSWTRRLNSQSAQVSSAGGHLYLVDDSAEKGQPTRVHSIDPATGRDRRSIAPACPPGPQDYYASNMSAGDGVYAVPGSKDLVSAFGFGDGCVVRWEATTNRVRFATRIRGTGSFDEDQTLVGPRDLVLGSSSEAMVRVSLANGAQTAMPAGVDQHAEPARIVGRTLLATTTTTRGTTRGGLAAWSLDSGRRLWNVPAPKGAQPTSKRHSSDALFDNSPRLVLATDGTTAHLFVFEGEGHKLTIQSVDVATGDLGDPVTTTYPTRYASGTPSLTVEALGRTKMLVSLDTLLVSIPFDGGAPKRYPN